MRDDKSEMLVIYGLEKNLPPLDPNDKGHFHPESAEFWLVFTGRIRYSFEGQQPFVASEGDIVYASWRAPRSRSLSGSITSSSSRSGAPSSTIACRKPFTKLATRTL